MTEAELAAAARAARGKDWPRAAALAGELRDRCPAHPAGYEIGITAARVLNRLEEAGAIVDAAQSRFGREAWLLIESARTEAARGEHASAATLAEALRDRFPQTPAGYQIGAAALRDLGRHQDSAAILALAAPAFADESWHLAESALTANAAADPHTAAALAAELRRRFPDHIVGYQAGATAARAMQLLEECAAIAGEAMVRFPNASWPLAEACSMAFLMNQRYDALRLAAELRTRFPALAIGHQTLARVLIQLDRLEEAETVLREAAPRFPGEDWPAQRADQAARTRADRAPALRLVQAMQRMPFLPQAGAAPRRVVVVLGMHRAGTSVCMRIVQHLGVALGGPLLSAGWDNQDGFQEHMTVVQFNQAVLSAAGYEWDSFHLVRKMPEGFWGSRAVTQAVETLKSVVSAEMDAAGGLWGFKDPRTLRLIPLWTRIFDELGVEPVWVLSVRDPRAVTSSLLSRNGMPAVLGNLLWLEHYLDALRQLGPRIACILHYERWFTDKPPQIQALASALGGATDAQIAAASASVRTALRHYEPTTDQPLLAMAGHLHALLCTPHPDLAQLQRQAIAAWQELGALTG